MNTSTVYKNLIFNTLKLSRIWCLRGIGIFEWKRRRIYFQSSLKHSINTASCNQPRLNINHKQMYFQRILRRCNYGWIAIKNAPCGHRFINPFWEKTFFLPWLIKYWMNKNANINLRIIQIDFIQNIIRDLLLCLRIMLQ